jgi:hypothetical protein
MFLFLIELFLLGVLIARFFSGKLPDFFLCVTSVLVGYLAYVLTGLLFASIGIPLTQFGMVIAVSFELVLVLIVHIVQKTFCKPDHKSFWITSIVVGLGYFGIVVFFYWNNLFFVTTDSVYLVVMARNLLESGLSQWYFASPTSMGLFVPMLQTLGMLFGYDYMWFIQPAFMGVFLALFIFFSLRSIKRFISRKFIRVLLVVIATGLLFSSDLIFIMTTYIHTNFNSGLFLFLAVAALYFAVEEENPSWLFFTPIFLIGFGMMRIENVIVALMVILVYSASGELTSGQLRLAFLPYLIVQFLWYFRVLLLEPQTYTDIMSDLQITLTLSAVAVMVMLLFLTEFNLFKAVLFPRVWWLLPLVLLICVLGIGATQSDQFINNLQVTAETMFLTGNWGAVWWVVIALAIIVPGRGQFPQRRVLTSIILSFFLIVHLLGLFRQPYHDRWFDSANRMLVHIVPVVIFSLLTKIVWFGRGADSESRNERISEEQQAGRTVLT